MFRSIASNALTLFIFGLVGLAVGLAWVRDQYVSQGPLENPICVRVEKGMRLAAVSETLLAQGAITHGRIFRLGADYEGKAQGLKFGSYLVPAGASMGQISNI